MKNGCSIRRWRFCLGLAALALVGVAWFVWKDRAGVTWLSEPERQASRLAFLGRWAWPVRAQVFRVRQWLFGSPGQVQLEAVIFESRAADWLALITNIISARTNEQGEVVVVLRETMNWSQMLRESPGVNVIALPRLLTGSGMPAQMASYEQRMVGTSTNLVAAQLGWSLQASPKLLAGGIGLSCFFTQTALGVESDPVNPEEILRTVVQTNLHFGARVTVPEGGGVLLFRPPATNGSGLWRGAYLRPRAIPQASQR